MSQPSFSNHEQSNLAPVDAVQTADVLERPPHLVNHVSAPFSVLCAFFERIRHEPNKKRDLVVKVFEVRSSEWDCFNSV